MNDKQDINININALGKGKQPFVPGWLRWGIIWLVVLACLTMVRQCF